MRKNRREFASFRGTSLAPSRPEEFADMNISKAAFGFLVAGMVAGAGGAYIATRSDAPAAVAAEQASAS
jgi:hypothetical protein